MFSAGWRAYLVSAAIWIPVFILVTVKAGAQDLSDLPILIQLFAFIAFFGTAAAIRKGFWLRPKREEPPPTGRVVVGQCESCGRPLRVKAHAVRDGMHLTCKCGHANDVIRKGV